MGNKISEKFVLTNEGIIMQHRDIPKKTKKDGDDLKFAPFASRVAQGILNYSQNETFIVSLEGEWGSGKTTLINFIKEDLKKEKEKVEILDFNPWLITGIEQIIKVFFDELIKVLAYDSFAVKWNEDIKKDLQTFASLILPDNINIDVGLIKLGYKPKNALLPKSEKTLSQIKEKINEYLRNLDKKIVVIVDDIDRLTDQETELIFRLTKGIADFDNLIYILLYDKKIVSKSLEKFKSENGQKYLEKIVQYPLTVPKPHKITIKNLLFKEIDEILEKLEESGVNYIFNEKTWRQEAHLIIDKYIRTVRDINQIVNIISFEYPIIATEVNFIDFFIISLIKLKNHTLYELIQNKPSNFFIDTNRGYQRKEEEKRIVENFNSNLKDFHDFRDLLEIIFPIFSEYNYTDSNRHKTKCISDIYYFENYFSFSISDDKISIKEYYLVKEKLLSADFESFKDVVIEIDEKQKSKHFLDMFYAYKDPMKTEEIENAFYNTLRVCKLLKDSSYEYLHLGYKLLLKHKSVDKFLLDFYKSDNKISFITKFELLQYVNYIIAKGNNEKVIITNGTLKELNETLKEKLENITLNNILKGEYQSYIVDFYDKLEVSLKSLSHELKEYIFKDTKSFFEILKVFKQVHSTYKDKRVSDQYLIDKNHLSKLIDLSVVEEYIRDLNLSTLTDEENILLTYWNNKEFFFL
jgi:predicted KAP-like P-loop ATPase